MTQIFVKTQEELDRIKIVNKEEEVTIEASLELRLNGILEIYGKVRLNTKVNCSLRENRYFRARENSSVEARGNSSVVARENSSVVARENSSVVARENSSVEAWGNSSVVARENSSVEAWGNSLIRDFSDLSKIIMHGFAVIFIPFKLKVNLKVKSKYVHIQKVKPLSWFENNAVEKKTKVILYKKVSKDFKTQEGTKNETLWAVGSTVTHPDWRPETGECGEYKFHACSRPYFCDEFRKQRGDRYIAVDIALKDLYEWKKNPDYPHKIGFRKGKVLYECNKFGKKVEAK